MLLPGISTALGTAVLSLENSGPRYFQKVRTNENNGVRYFRGFHPTSART
jgi:hypothetical protein